jgi:hypothetical protein
MLFKRGLWLILLDQAGEATPVACEVTRRNCGTWHLETTVPPQVYPVTFVAARLRLDGHHLGLLRLSPAITTRTHEPLDLELEFPVNEAQLAQATRR